MWRYILAVCAVFIISNAYADSTKEMKDHDLLTDGATDDTVWVYDTSESSLKRMTTEEFVKDYLSGLSGWATDRVLQIDATGGLQWNLAATVSGTGTTLYDTDSGAALSRLAGGANRIGIAGGAGISTSGSGGTVTVTADITQSDLTSITNASAFSGPTAFAVDSQVTNELTARTNTSAFTGASAFLTNSDGVQSTEVVYGGASKFFVYGGTTLTGAMLAGGMLFCHASSPITLGIPDFSGSTPYFLVYDMTGSGVTVQTTDGDVLYNDDESGTALFVNAGNSRHSASFTCNAESGSCSYVVTLGVTGDYWDTE